MKNLCARRVVGGIPFFLAATWPKLGASLALAGALLLVGCSQPTPETAPQASASTTQSAATQEKTTIKYAKGFTIKYFDGYKVVSILNPFRDHTDTTRYVLVQRGARHPVGYKDSPVIEIPIRSLVGMSSMHVALTDFLDADDVLIGLGSLQYASAPTVRKRIAAGKITDFGRENALNEELAITQHPDLIMTMGSPGSPAERYHTLAEAGVPVMVNSEWVETTPLARAEWVKLMAALLNKEDIVNQRFAKVEAEYQRLTALTRQLPRRPQVLTGLPFKDTWYMPDGESYTAQFFRDAGGSYHWDKERAAGSLALSFEAVYPVALTAECWLNTGTANTKADILAQDARYADFQPFKTGTLYNNNKRTDAQGSNDYWESGAVHPEVVLADLIKILHPELLPQHELVYYKQVK